MAGSSGAGGVGGKVDTRLYEEAMREAPAAESKSTKKTGSAVTGSILAEFAGGLAELKEMLVDAKDLGTTGYSFPAAGEEDTTHEAVKTGGDKTLAQLSVTIKAGFEAVSNVEGMPDLLAGLGEQFASMNGMEQLQALSGLSRQAGSADMTALMDKAVEVSGKKNVQEVLNGMQGPVADALGAIKSATSLISQESMKMGGASPKKSRSGGKKNA